MQQIESKEMTIPQADLFKTIAQMGLENWRPAFWSPSLGIPSWYVIFQRPQQETKAPTRKTARRQKQAASGNGSTVIQRPFP